MLKPLVSLLVLAPVMSLPLSAQTSAGPAGARQSSLTLVNALPGPDNLHIKFGAEEIWPPGFTPGQSTGAVLFPSGKKVVELRCEGFAITRTEIDLPPGGNFAMVLYPGEEATEGPDKGKRKIGLFGPPPILPQQAPTGKNWQVLLVGPLAQTRLIINQKAVDLKAGQAVVADSNGGQIQVADGEKILLSSSPEGAGNYWVVIFGEKQESLQAVCLNHINYTVAP